MKINSSVLAVGIAALTLAGCGKKSGDGSSDTTAMRRDSTGASTAMTGTDTGAMGRTDSTTRMRGDTGMKADSNKMAMAPGTMTDANILYVLDHANVADSSEGFVASKKATDSGVHDFGHMMMTDHHTLRAQGMALAKKLNITPSAPSGDKSDAEAASALETLNSTPKGAAWDKAYIDMQVADHQKVLATAQAAMGQAQSQDLKDMLTKATPVIQKHLDRAMALQKKTAAM